MKPGRELDAIVAEQVFGCLIDRNQVGPWQIHETQSNGIVVLKSIPPYSTDWAAAGEVAEKLRIALVPLEGGRWAASQDEQSIMWMERGKPCYSYFERNLDSWSIADTAPHAICLAAIAEDEEI
jgi:hypothetical protein